VTFPLRHPRIRLALLLAACALLSSSNAFTQRNNKRTPAPTAQTKRQRADSTRRAARVREAVNALLETADAARAIEDLDERTRILTLSADALWPADETSARTLFRRAWETATDADRAAREESVASFSARVGFGAVVQAAPLSNYPTTRFQVLSKLAVRDPRLAETFLREMLDGAEEKSEKNADQTRESRRRQSVWREMSDAGRSRLALASSLVNQGKYQSAAAVAAPLVDEGASGDLMQFLVRLRLVLPAEVDALYLRLLQRTGADPQADANDVLLLSSLVVSPKLLVVVDDEGAVALRPTAYRTDAEGFPWPEVQPRVREAFFQLAATVFLRSAQAAEGNSATLHKLPLYFAIGRMLPFFERDAPVFVPELNIRYNSLAVEMNAKIPDSLSAEMSRRSLTQENPTDPLRPQLDVLSRETDEKKIDRLRLDIVRQAARRASWERARKFADEIKDEKLRRHAHALIAARQIAALTEAFKDDDAPDDFERAASFVAGADVPPFVRAWGFAQAAGMAARRGKRARANELLTDASRFAASTEPNTFARVVAYAVVTGAAARVERERAWELLASAVRAANAIEDLSGEESAVELFPVASSDEDDEDAVSFAIDADAFRLDELFATMARLDSTRAFIEARTLKGRLPRAYVLIAAARVVLDKAKPDRP
jgi:hypothetical protein